MATTLFERETPVKFSDEQFAKLVELLTPGYELSKIFLAQHQAAQPAPDQPPEEKATEQKTLDGLNGSLGA